MSYQGRIENWNNERGFGFVEPLEGGTRAFVHIKAFCDRRRRPVEGDLIVYEVEFDAENRPQAVNINYRFINENDQFSDMMSNSNWAGAFFAVAFLGTLLALCVLGMTPMFILPVYLIVSAIAFAAYRSDKLAAMNNRWRTPEITLQMLALFGGWPGALLGQKIFRHKTSKKEFQSVFWLVVCVNCAVFGWTLTEQAAPYVRLLSGSPIANRLFSDDNEDSLPRIRPRVRSSEP